MMQIDTFVNFWLQAFLFFDRFRCLSGKKSLETFVRNIRQDIKEDYVSVLSN